MIFEYDFVYVVAEGDGFELIKIYWVIHLRDESYNVALKGE
jgi:hypothetical protein